ncbi:MAG: hypothetical protein B0A82_11140 [Alkalinema sp. CACIAM 70d]|nr:MAG: hypothetical protein B0A82_11140 [Alkalinema sp. CACIAM 70d]
MLTNSINCSASTFYLFTLTISNSYDTDKEFPILIQKKLIMISNPYDRSNLIDLPQNAIDWEIADKDQNIVWLHGIGLAPHKISTI